MRLGNVAPNVHSEGRAACGASLSTVGLGGVARTLGGRPRIVGCFANSVPTESGRSVSEERKESANGQIKDSAPATVEFANH